MFLTLFLNTFCTSTRVKCGILRKYNKLKNRCNKLKDIKYFEIYNCHLSKNSDIRKKYKSNKSYTVVHFRLGDSKRAKKMISYYEEVRKMILESNEEILIATDSPKEAEIFFKNCPNVRLSGAKNALEDFKYMVNSKRLYCAPSTFSWWALHSLDNDSSAVIPEFFKDDLGVYINEDRVTIY